MVVKVKEKFEKTRHVESNDKSKKTFYVEKNVRYHGRILSQFDDKRCYENKPWDLMSFHNFT